jgi:hypothetical protein
MSHRQKGPRNSARSLVQTAALEVINRMRVIRIRTIHKQPKKSCVEDGIYRILPSGNLTSVQIHILSDDLLLEAHQSFLLESFVPS